MKHRALLIVAGLVGAATLAASLSVAAAGTSRPASHATPTKSAAIAPPAVPNAAAIKANADSDVLEQPGLNVNQAEFNLNQPGALESIMHGEKCGTLVHDMEEPQWDVR